MLRKLDPLLSMKSPNQRTRNFYVVYTFLEHSDKGYGARFVSNKLDLDCVYIQGTIGQLLLLHLTLFPDQRERERESEREREREILQLQHLFIAGVF